MRNNEPRYYSFRLAHEKLKHKTWLLIVIARLLTFLMCLTAHC
jgi:hypothetical protein